MKYLRQFLLLFLFSFLGELLRTLIPYPIPASIYGMVLLFLALSTGLVKLEWIKDTGDFLVSLFPLLFIAPVVSLIDSWDAIRANLLPMLFLLLFSSVFCFFVTGRFTQWLIRRRKEKDDD